MTIAFRTPTDFIVFVENQLGWTPETSEKKPLWKARAIEVAKLKKKMATDPNLYTWDNLALAVEYLRHKRQPVTSPVAVCWFVKDALKDAVERPTLTDLGEAVQAAIDWEKRHQIPGFAEWIITLTRAHGSARGAVLDEWRSAGRG